jgi:hypothetical protein
MWHSLVYYWVCYCTFHSMGMKVLPRVSWPGLKARNVTEWCQSMSGYSRVAYPDLGLVGGTLHNWYQSFSSTLSLDGPEGCN